MDEQILKKIDSFFSQFKQLNFKKGEILINADENPSTIFYLKEGLVKEYYLTKNGDESVVNIFKPGTFFPMPAAFDIENSFYFETATNSVIFRAPKENALQFVKNNPDVLLDLLRRVYIGTNGLLLRIGYLMAGKAYEQLIVELLIHAKRFGKKENDGSLSFMATEKDLGTHAGLTRETVSREMKKLKEKNLAIFNQGTITIPNLKSLENELR